MKSKSLAVVGLSETRMKSSGEEVLHGNNKLIYSGKEDGRHGVELIHSTERAPYVENVESVSERIISICFKTKTIKFSLYQVFVLQKGRPSPEKDQFYQDLQEATDTARYTGKLIVCGYSYHSKVVHLDLYHTIGSVIFSNYLFQFILMWFNWYNIV